MSKMYRIFVTVFATSCPCNHGSTQQTSNSLQGRTWKVRALIIAQARHTWMQNLPALYCRCHISLQPMLQRRHEHTQSISLNIAEEPGCAFSMNPSGRRDALTITMQPHLVTCKCPRSYLHVGRCTSDCLDAMIRPCKKATSSLQAWSSGAILPLNSLSSSSKYATRVGSVSTTTRTTRTTWPEISGLRWRCPSLPEFVTRRIL